MNFYIYRSNSSSYLIENFKEIEAKKFSEILGLPKIDNLNQWNPTSDDRLIIITSTHSRANEIPLRLKDSIAFFIHPNSGYDNLIGWIESFEKPVILGNPIRRNGVSEYILSCLFKHYQTLPKSDDWDITRTWNRTLLSDSRFLIFGFGHIGQLVCKFLTMFNSSIDIIDPYIHQWNPKSLDLTYDQLYQHHENLDLKQYNGIIMCCSLNKLNYHIIDQSFLSQVSDDLLFINPARGGLVNFDHLIQHCQSHPQFQAYIDVFENEPYSFKKHQNLNNLYCSSHLAGVDKDISIRLIDFELEVVKNYLSDHSHGNLNEFFDQYSHLILKNRQIKGSLYV